MDLRWVSGSVITTGWVVSGSVLMGIPSILEPRLGLWTAWSPSSVCCIDDDRPSYAAAMLAQIVSPPTGGSNTARRVATYGGCSSNVASVCQPVLLSCPAYIPPSDPLVSAES